MNIRRIASPLTSLDENLNDANYKEYRRRKKQEFQKNLEQPSSILIGSIKEINQRVCDFETQLSTYDCRLTIQSRAGDERPRNDKSRDGITFEGAYQNNLKNYSSNISKTKKKKIKGETPQLVELQQYPGFVKNTPTSLPHSVQINTINHKVVNALTHLKTKPKYKVKFEEALASGYHHNILKDFFWWIFLHKYYPNVDVQAKLFKRIAMNYGWFFMGIDSHRFRNVFFMEYPEVLAQSLYSAYTAAFPQSWKQFDDDEFKNLLSRITNLWISGIRPHPRSYLKWNKLQLEPNNMREGQSFKSDSGGKKKAGGLKLGGIKSLEKTESNASTIASRSTNSKIKFETGSLKSKNVRQRSSVTQRKPTKIPNESLEHTRHSSAVDPHEICFDHSKFNLNGKSPLLDEFLHQSKVSQSSKAGTIVARTQVMSLPKFNCCTLDDVLDESRRVTGGIRKSFEHIQANGDDAFREFKAKQLEYNKMIDLGTKQLLEDRAKISLLSNLVMTEMKKDSNSSAKEAQHAIWLTVVADKDV